MAESPSRLGRSAHRKSSDAEKSDLHSYTREQTIDILERKQEAMVLDYLRRHSLEKKSSAMNLGIDDTAIPCQNIVAQNKFEDLTNSEIADVLAEEQVLLESRIRRSVSRKSSR